MLSCFAFLQLPLLFFSLFFMQKDFKIRYFSMNIIDFLTIDVAPLFIKSKIFIFS